MDSYGGSMYDMSYGGSMYDMGYGSDMYDMGYGMDMYDMNYGMEHYGNSTYPMDNHYHHDDYHDCDGSGDDSRGDLPFPPPECGPKPVGAGDMSPKQVFDDIDKNKSGSVDAQEGFNALYCAV